MKKPGGTTATQRTIPCCVARAFTLIEILLSAAILGFFLVYCSDLLISTLTAKEDIDADYREQRARGVGWHILYLDLARALGPSFIEGTVWTGAGILSTTDAGQAPPPSGKSPGGEALFFFDASNKSEPFLSLAVSNGRAQAKKGDLGFRRVEYSLLPHPEGEGLLLLRHETRWNPYLSKKDQEFGSDEQKPDFTRDYRRYTVLEGLEEAVPWVYNGEEWVEKWDSAEKNDVPLALKIVYHRRGEEAEKVRIVPLPISNLPVKEPKENF